MEVENESHLLESQINVDRRYGEILVDEITWDEYNVAMQQLKMKKTSGQDMFTSEIIKEISESIHKILCKYFDEIYNTINIPPS